MCLMWVSPQAEIKNAHVLLGSGQKLNEKVGFVLKALNHLYEPAIIVLKAVCSVSCSRMDTHRPSHS